MKNTIIIITILLFSAISYAKVCLCGDYPIHYQYHVLGTGGCCSGTASTQNGLVQTYSQDISGNWILINSEYQNSASLQEICCQDT